MAPRPIFRPTNSPRALRAGDIVIVKGRSWFARAIRWATRSPGEAKTRASHVALAVTETEIVEALSQGVVRRPMPDGYAFAIYRPRFLTAKERTRVAWRGLSYVGAPYGWGKIALHALGLRRLCFLDGYPICSYVVAASFAAVGHTFGVAPAAATPDDIDDICRGDPDRYERIL